MTARPVLYGYEGSTFTRMARLALALKGVGYDFVEVAAWDGTGKLPEHLDRHPFAKVPLFIDGAFELYETAAITRYVDEAFPGTALQPSEAPARARMQQIISVHDHYVQPCWIRILASQLLFNPLYGAATDDGLVERTWPQAQRAAHALEALLADRNPTAPDLADIQLAPTMRYFTELPRGTAIVSDLPRLTAWWAWMESQPLVREIVRPTRWERLL